VRSTASSTRSHPRYPSLPTVIESDQGLKVQLADRLPLAPQLIILGSSRAMKAQPSYRGRGSTCRASMPPSRTRCPGTPGRLPTSSTTGSPAPAAVSVVCRRRIVPGLADRLGAAERAGALAVPVERPESQDASGGAGSSLELGDGNRLVARAQCRALRSGGSATTGERCRLGPRTTAFGSSVFTADGFRLVDYHDRARAHGLTLAKALPGTIAEYVGHLQRLQAPRPARVSFFERTIQRMNAWGATPVVVLTHNQPRLLTALKRVGWNARHRQVLAYLHLLQGRYQSSCSTCPRSRALA